MFVFIFIGQTWLKKYSKTPDLIKKNRLISDKINQSSKYKEITRIKRAKNTSSW